MKTDANLTVNDMSALSSLQLGYVFLILTIPVTLYIYIYTSWIVLNSGSRWFMPLLPPGKMSWGNTPFTVRLLFISSWTFLDWSWDNKLHLLSDRVSDVKWMVVGIINRNIPTMDKKSVGLASLHNQLWYECVIDVPGDAPPRLTWNYHWVLYIGIVHHIHATINVNTK